MKRIVLGLWSSRAALLFFSLKLFGEGLYYVLPLFIAYVLSPELFTSFTLAQMLVVLWATLTFGIFQTPLIVKGVKESSLQDHIRASFTTVLVLFFVSLFLGFFVLFFCRGLILDFTLLPLSDLLSLLAFLFGLLLKRFVDGVFLALSLKLRNAWYDVLTGFFSFVFLGICFLFFGSLTLSQVFFSYFFSSFFALLFSFLFFLTKNFFLCLLIGRFSLRFFVGVCGRCLGLLRCILLIGGILLFCVFSLLFRRLRRMLWPILFSRLLLARLCS